MAGNQTTQLHQVIDFNKKFVEDKAYEQYQTTKHPNKKMVVLSCMDTRLTELLPQAMNIKNGDAKIIKNAGATIMHPFGSITRSIIVAIYEFHAEEVFVVGHHGCGMSHLDSEVLIGKMVDRGITQETLDTLYYSGRKIDQWLHGFGSVEEAIKQSVKIIKNHPLVPNDVAVHGLVMDPDTGALEIIVDGSL